MRRTEIACFYLGFRVIEMLCFYEQYFFVSFIFMSSISERETTSALDVILKFKI